MIKEGALVRVIGGSDGKSRCNDIGEVVRVTPKMVKFRLLRNDVTATKAKKNLVVIPQDEVEAIVKKALTEKENYDPEKHGDTLVVRDLEETAKEELKAVLEKEFGKIEKCQYLPYAREFLVLFVASESTELAVKARVVTVGGKTCTMALSDTSTVPPQLADSAGEANASWRVTPYQPNGPPSMPKKSKFDFMQEQGAKAKANKRRRLG